MELISIFWWVVVCIVITVLLWLAFRNASNTYISNNSYIIAGLVAIIFTWTIFMVTRAFFRNSEENDENYAKDESTFSDFTFSIVTILVSLASVATMFARLNRLRAGETDISK